MNKDNKNVEGGSPSKSGPDSGTIQEDDSKKPSKQIKKDAIDESEKENMNDHEGYNETDPNVPVESTK
ncbi:hypothetical protein L0657_04220 [Dyadobacter sp. CY345]|uniref:hypothetical protein n=1 Tax=Dyadobacter sp. CY345 TaxID=2909335 RepID=UPI001F46F6D4|nr:hypothetical protein [Dyadobacter sp. CY345]MCF2443153.1 hypothetical protein [Dyadobacter sp. CY345]